MDISAGIQASLAGRSASALFDLASENGVVTAVESDLDKLEAGLEQSADLRMLTNSPKVGRNAAEKALWSVGAIMGLSDLTQKFLGTLANNRRLSQLPAVIRAFRMIASAQRGEVSAEVTSAHALTDAQFDQLKMRLTQREGRTVKLTSKVDPDLLGGLVVTIGSRRIDASIRTRLNSLARAMTA